MNSLCNSEQSNIFTYKPEHQSFEVRDSFVCIISGRIFQNPKKEKFVVDIVNWDVRLKGIEKPNDPLLV